MFDLRNHGQSQEGTNKWITWGLDERLDVFAVINFISNHKDYKNTKIGLLSICMLPQLLIWNGKRNGI